MAILSKKNRSQENPVKSMKQSNHCNNLAGACIYLGVAVVQTWNASVHRTWQHYARKERERVELMDFIRQAETIFLPSVWSSKKASQLFLFFLFDAPNVVRLERRGRCLPARWAKRMKTQSLSFKRAGHWLRVRLTAGESSVCFTRSQATQSADASATVPVALKSNLLD